MFLHITFANSSNPYCRFGLSADQLRAEVEAWGKHYNITGYWVGGPGFWAYAAERDIFQAKGADVCPCF